MGALLGQIVLALLSATQTKPRPFLPFWSLVAIALLFSLLAVGFIASAAFLVLAESMGPPAAAAMVAAGLLVLAAILFLVATLLRKSPSAEAEAPPLVTLVEQLATQAEQHMQGKTPLMLLGVGLLGLVVGYSPTLRRILRNLSDSGDGSIR